MDLSDLRGCRNSTTHTPPLLCRFEKREHHSTSKCFAVFLLMRALFIIDVRSRELYQSTAVWGEQVSVPCRLPCPTLTTRMSRFLAAWHKLFSGEYHRALCETCSAFRVMLSAACAMFWMLGDSPFATRNSPLLRNCCRTPRLLFCAAYMPHVAFARLMVLFAAAATAICCCQNMQ